MTDQRPQQPARPPAPSASDNPPADGDRLFTAIYHELRGVAGLHMGRERPDQTLQTTALVHEAYLRLANEGRTRWDSIGQFMLAAAEAMRRILIERARARRADKRGGNWRRVPLKTEEVLLEERIEELLDLDEALRRLEEANDEWATVVKLRYFAGLTHAQTAEALDKPQHVVKRQWLAARAWLHQQIRDAHDERGQ